MRSLRSLQAAADQRHANTTGLELAIERSARAYRRGPTPRRHADLSQIVVALQHALGSARPHGNPPRKLRSKLTWLYG